MSLKKKKKHFLSVFFLEANFFFFFFNCITNWQSYFPRVFSSIITGFPLPVMLFTATLFVLSLSVFDSFVMKFISA